MIKPPCKECTQRVLHCHSSCQAYKKYRAKLDQHNAKIHAVKEQEVRLIEHFQRKK